MQTCRVIIEGMCVSAEMHSASAQLSFRNIIHIGKISLKKPILLKIPAKPTAMIISEVHFSFTSIIQGALLNPLTSIYQQYSANTYWLPFRVLEK